MIVSVPPSEGKYVTDRVGIVDCGLLVRLRRTFRYPWRIGLVLCFFIAVWLVTMIVVGMSSGANPETLSDEFFLRQARNAFLIFIIPTGIAFFRRDAFARLYFGIAAWVTAWMVVLAVLVAASKRSLEENIAQIFALAALVIAWLWFRSGSVLLRSVIPLRRWQPFREQLRITEQANAQRRAASRDHPPLPALRASSVGAFLLFITGSAAAWITTLCFVGVLLMAESSPPFRRAITSFDFKSATKIARTVRPDPGSNEPTASSAILQAGLLLLAYVPAVIAGYLWHRWRRSRVQVHIASADEKIPAGSVVLLRHSKDDVIRIPTRHFKLTRAPFMAYEWNFTLEELLATRLAHVGPLHALVSHRASLPPLGAIWRRYSDDDWHPILTASLPDARMVVTIMGAIKDGHLESAPLQQEMDLLREGGYLDKTLFIMPPLILPWRIRARWRHLLDLTIPGASAHRKVRRLAKRGLGVCFVQKMPVILSGTHQDELFYESALDIAGAFVTGDAGGAVVPKHLQLVLEQAKG